MFEEDEKETLKELREIQKSNENWKNYLDILDLLINADYLPAIEEKGLYYQFYDESHDKGITVRNTSTNTWNNNHIP